MEITFHSPKKVAKGTRISLVNPVTLNTPVLAGSACPFGIDCETDWKWSIKLEFDSTSTGTSGASDEYRFANIIETLDHAIVDKIQTVWFPTTHGEYFYMRSIYPPTNKLGNKLGNKLQMRVKIPVKNGIATQTYFTGDHHGETKRLLTLEDGEILKDPKYNIQLTLKWTCVWIMDESKTISCDWSITDIQMR
jgi:hypothetical protein